MEQQFYGFPRPEIQHQSIMKILYIASRALVIKPEEKKKFGIKDVVNTMVTEDELPFFEPQKRNKNVIAIYYSKHGELCVGELNRLKQRPGWYNLSITVFRDEMSCRLFILQKVPSWRSLIRYLMN